MWDNQRHGSADDAPEPPGHFGPAARCPGLEVEPDWDGLGPVHELWTALRGGAANAAAPRPRPDDLGARMAMTEEHQATGSHAGRTPAQWHAASFKPVPRSVREARQFVGSLLEDPFLRETSELLVSELTTNALQHAVGEFEVRVRAEPRVRVEVCDRSSLPPIPKDLAPSDESGRGLHIVTRLATSWGTREAARGQGRLVRTLTLEFPARAWPRPTGPTKGPARPRSGIVLLGTAVNTLQCGPWGAAAQLRWFQSREAPGIPPASQRSPRRAPRS